MKIYDRYELESLTTEAQWREILDDARIFRDPYGNLRIYISRNYDEWSELYNLPELGTD